MFLLMLLLVARSWKFVLLVPMKLLQLGPLVGPYGLCGRLGPDLENLLAGPQKAQS